MAAAAPPFDVDFVWTYCSALRRLSEQQFPPHGEQLSVPCALVDDLKYSIRAVCLHAPWFRHIVVVVADDDCVPGWLKADAPRLRIIKHSEFMPKATLPSFNSNVVESYVHKIEGLSECFVYLNDDTYIGVPTPWTGFFTPAGLPINRHCRGPPDHGLAPTSNMFVRMMQHAIREHGMHYTRYQHQMQPCKRSLMAHYERRFAGALRATRRNRHRQPNDFNLLRFTTCFSTSERKAPHVKTGDRTDYFTEGGDEAGVHAIPTAGKGGRRPPRFFCINNTVRKYDHVYAVLQHLFPLPSRFERN
ncbi:hypothetical protein HYH03_003658 [Edaphochlamys debaryana]|uniref:Stealth protein CR2 conserved region 2 domain-containing protein n=1 Tax=Edaphochlamys debaryana TaxID=47281 RepID=A0A836C456_9CHLO|nr:hypothetical protein HYH03_003658 [Edaphochlamys debaryana]|eukprot:KAG2498399.1 hypothetical protein HYH03_003658 [Edaphochlamys debaryana]